VYILILPFQLYKSLEWITIPASVFAAYIILGIALIGMCAFLSVPRGVVVRWEVLPC
jgi:predicted membrane chloride channel (bestrophin family)